MDVTMLSEMDNLAEIIHSESCNDSTACGRWAVSPGHRDYYLGRANVIMDRLQPVIGSANVPTAVRVILSEMA
jgi:hypothetical protein